MDKTAEILQRCSETQKRIIGIPTKLPISVCIIACNEEKNIKDCLDTLDFAQEVILVDTGSTDKTLEIAETYFNVRIFQKKFNVKYFKDFKFHSLFHYSNARNYALSQATSDYILIIDCDERVVEPKHFGDLISKHPLVDAWRVLQISQVLNNEGQLVEVPVSNTRFWKNNLGIRYEKIVHETVDIYLEEKGLKIGASDIRINHVGFQDDNANKKKALKIIEALLYEKSYYHNYYIAIAYMQAGFLEEATKYFYLAVEDKMPNNIMAHAWAIIADINRQKGNFYYRLADEAVEKSLKLAPKQNLSRVIKSEMLKKFGHRNEARKELKKLKVGDVSDLHQDILLNEGQIKQLQKEMA